MPARATELGAPARGARVKGVAGDPAESERVSASGSGAAASAAGVRSPRRGRRRAATRGPHGGSARTREVRRGMPRHPRRAPRSPIAAPARSASASLRSDDPSVRTRSSREGSQTTGQAHWNHDPARVRRCASPTSLRPSAVRISPGPRPPKQTSDDHRVAAAVRTWCRWIPPTPSVPSAPSHSSPSQSKERPTSSTARGSPAGNHTSTQRGSPRSTSTAPPPLRRRATATPAARAASRSTAASGWVDPRTTLGASAAQTATARDRGAVSTAGQPACSDSALPCRRSSVQC